MSRSRAGRWSPVLRVVGPGNIVVVADDTTWPMRFYRARVE